MFYKWGGSDILSISTLNHYSRILKFVAVILLQKKYGIIWELFLKVGGGPFQKNKSYPHFLMLWSLYNRYLTLKIVSLQNQVPVRPNHFF